MQENAYIYEKEEIQIISEVQETQINLVNVSWKFMIQL